MNEALEGIKVLDLCRSYPPAFASMFLADFSSEVIRIDPPGFSFPVPMKGGPESFSAYYALDRNKKSISLNLKDKNGLEIFSKLAKKADVIIENSKPGTMEDLGIGYQRISGLNPRLIYCSVSGYGQDGPYSMLPGHDSNYLAIAGALSMLGPKGGPPIPPSNLLADIAGAGLYSLTAILVALLVREKTGKGQFIDISYTDAVCSLLTFETAMYFLTGVQPKRGETFTTGADPCYASYETKDGKYFNIGCIEPRLWDNLCKALELRQFIPLQWTKDEKIKAEIFVAFRNIFLTKTRDEWWEWAQDKEIAVAPVLDLEETFHDPHIKYRKMIMELDHDTMGKVKQTGFPLKFSSTPCKFKGFAPTAGQNTVQILKELGYDERQIESLKKAGTI